MPTTVIRFTGTRGTYFYFKRFTILANGEVFAMYTDDMTEAKQFDVVLDAVEYAKHINHVVTHKRDFRICVNYKSWGVQHVV